MLCILLLRSPGQDFLDKRDACGNSPMRLILHAGTHKTGTTSIQKALADNRGRLCKQGLIYPDGGAAFGRDSKSHHLFAHALTGSDPMGRRKAEIFLNSARSLASSGDTILISSEPVYRHVAAHDPSAGPADYWTLRRQYLETLAGVLRGFDVTVLLYFRERASFAESMFLELVRKGHGVGTFQEFLARDEHRYDYERQLELFSEIFATVRVESYEAARDAGLVTSFFRVIGFPAPPGVENIWERRSHVPERPLFSSEADRQAFLAKYSRPG
jgi:hypothetical protein